MRSNSWSFSAAVCVVLATSGCSYLFGPKADDPKPFVKTQSLCIKDVPANLKAWLADGKSDIGSSVDCIVGSIDDFSKHVEGQTKSVYTQGELSEFISQFLTAQDSPNAGETMSETEQILRVKQILLGGASDTVTKDELSRLKSLLLRARPLLIEVSPNIQTLLFRSEKASIDEVTAARASLGKLLELIATEFDQHNAGRPEAGFRDLLSSAHKLGLENDSVSEWIPLVESVKVIVLSGEPDQLRGSEWAPMIRSIAQAWGLAVRIKYNVNGNSEILGSDFPVFEAALHEGLDFLNKAVVAHNGSIPNKTLENLIDALQMQKLIPFGISTMTAKKILPIAFGKLLYGRAYDSWSDHSGYLGTEHIARLRAILNDFMSGQEVINQVMSKRSEISLSQFGTSLAAIKLDRKSFLDGQTFTLAQRGQQQLLTFISKGRPPIHDEEGRMIVETRSALPPIRKSDLNSMNLLRVLVGSVLAGWTHDRASADNITGLIDTEVQEAYLDFRDLGHDLNFIDIRSNQAGIRTFMENAIFMSSSDGNPRMGLQEGVEWFNFVSSGGAIADKLYAKIAQYVDSTGRACSVLDYPNREFPKRSSLIIDVLGLPKTRPSCFREAFLKEGLQALPNLPRLVSWIRKDGSGERAKAVLIALEGAGRTRGASNDDPVDSSEFRSMMPIAHYLESIFARFDTDQSDVLESDEIAKTLPLLSPFIKKMANGSANSTNMQQLVLSYIINNGTVPDGSTFGGKADFAWWWAKHKLGIYSDTADRLKILTVIGSFGQAAKTARVKSIDDFHDDADVGLRALIKTKEPTTAAKIADLFQCLPASATPGKDAAAILARDAASNLDLLAPADGPIDNDEYIALMKHMIDLDPALDSLCLPF